MSILLKNKQTKLWTLPDVQRKLPVLDSFSRYQKSVDVRYHRNLKSHGEFRVGDYKLSDAVKWFL